MYFIKCRWENEKFNTVHDAKALSRAWSFYTATLTKPRPFKNTSHIKVNFRSL
jgi:hypothetical protein